MYLISRDLMCIISDCIASRGRGFGGGKTRSGGKGTPIWSIHPEIVRVYMQLDAAPGQEVRLVIRAGHASQVVPRWLADELKTSSFVCARVMLRYYDGEVALTSQLLENS